MAKELSALKYVFLTLSTTILCLLINLSGTPYTSVSQAQVPPENCLGVVAGLDSIEDSIALKIEYERRLFDFFEDLIKATSVSSKSELERELSSYQEEIANLKGRANPDNADDAIKEAFKTLQQEFAEEFAEADLQTLSETDLKQKRDEIQTKLDGSTAVKETAKLQGFINILDVLLTYKQNQQRLQEEIADNQAQISRLENDITNLNTLQDEVDLIRTCQLRLDEKIRTIADQKQDMIQKLESNFYFRLVVSIAFSAIVFLVISKFFEIINRRDKVVYELFLSQQGIQVITLFLIVISIILLGLLGILESKELSALLGGLSGYILGRTSAPDHSSSLLITEQPEKQPAAPEPEEPPVRSDHSDTNNPNPVETKS